MAKHNLAGQLDLPVPDMPNAPVLRGTVGIITVMELAALLDVAEQTLAGWRSTGQGPRYAKLGKSVFYRLDDIKAWIVTSVTSAGKEPE